MRNFLLILMGLVISIPVWAQNDSNQKPSYNQQMQKLFTQKSAQSQAQFDRAYPKPVAPVIPSTSQQSSENAPQAYQAYKPEAPKSYSYEQEKTPANVAPNPSNSPSVAVTQEKKNNPSYNIFVPPSTDNNNNASSSSQNLYR